VKTNAGAVEGYGVPINDAGGSEDSGV